jgi:hypothetical protein
LLQEKIDTSLLAYSLNAKGMTVMHIN